MFIAYFGGRHFCVDVLAVKFVLRSVTFFPSKICNKHTNIYGGTEEFRKISTFSKFKILKIFVPLFLGGSGALAPYFQNSSVLLPHVSSYYTLNFTSTVSPHHEAVELPKGLTNSIYIRR